MLCRLQSRHNALLVVRTVPLHTCKEDIPNKPPTFQLYRENTPTSTIASFIDIPLGLWNSDRAARAKTSVPLLPPHNILCSNLHVLSSWMFPPPPLLGTNTVCPGLLSCLCNRELVPHYSTGRAFFSEQINSFTPNNTIWWHHGHGLSISLGEFIWGV